MAFTVVGFDLGCQNSYVAVARSGGIETVANEYSDRCTASYVSFTETTRFIGHSARQRAITNTRDTLHSFVRFVGKSWDDPAVQAELPYLPYKLVRTDSGGVGFRVRYLGQDCVFTAEQVTAMMLTKLKSVAEAELGAPVTDCVLNAPSYYDDRERRALLDASRIAGLNCLRLVSDVAAVALNYGLHQKDLPDVGLPPRTVLLVDMGHSALQVGLVAFNAGRARVLATACDPGLGGRDLDRALFNRLAEDFAGRLGLDARSSAKAQLKLTEACARAKHLMSANSAALPVTVECLAEERDAVGSVNRADFSRLLEDCGILRRVRDCVGQCLAAAGGSSAVVLDAIELVGGSTRVPAVKAAVADAVLAGVPLRSTLNADEAVARGCALACAMLSPGCRVRQRFQLADCQPYSVCLVAPWLGRSGAPRAALEVFPAGPFVTPPQEQAENGGEASADLAGAAVAVRVLRLPVPPEAGLAARVRFELAAGYTNRHDVALADRQIAKYLLASETGGGHQQQQQQLLPPQGPICLRVRAELDRHGLFALTRACLQEAEPGWDTGAFAGQCRDPAPGWDGQPSQLQQQQAVAVRRWSVPLTIQEVPCADRLSSELLTQFRTREAEMSEQEARERDRVAARNSVEEYVYEMRARLADGLADKLTDAERVGFAHALSDTEAWLYGEGERLEEQAYLDRLARLRRKGDAYCRRGEAAGPAWGQ